MAQLVTLSESAAKRVQEIVAGDATAAGKMLRLSVNGGGCSGFSYAFSFDDAVGEEDKVFESHGTKVVIDETSLDLLDGSEIDYVQELIGASFQVKNPNATASCGCGTSFSI